MAELPPDVRTLTAPDRLLDLLDGLPAGSLVGFEPSPEHLALHVAVLPADDRMAAAALFGLRAAPGWVAAGVVVEGRVRSAEGGSGERGRVRLGVVVDVDGATAHRVDPLDPGAGGPARSLNDSAPAGLLVDGLMRVLGRPSRSPTPPAHETGVRMWAQSVVTAALDGEPLGWAAVVALHPGRPAEAPAPLPSLETIVAATLRAGRIDWVGIHRRAASGRGPVPPDLDRSEVAWMDPPMYARWSLGSFADEATAAMVLRAHDEADAAHRFERACAATREVGERRG